MLAGLCLLLPLLVDDGDDGVLGMLLLLSWYICDDLRVWPSWLALTDDRLLVLELASRLD